MTKDYILPLGISIRTLLSLPFMVVILLFSFVVPVSAGKISLKIKSTTSVNNRKVSTQFLIQNRGSDEAQDVSVSAKLFGQERTAWVAREIPPEGSGEASIQFELPKHTYGTFPIFATLSYHSQRGRSFSGAMLAVARTPGAPKSLVSVDLNKEATEDGIYVHVVLLDPSSSLGEVTLTCHIPDDLTVTTQLQRVHFKDGKATARFQIRNLKGAEGSRYGIFVTAEYDHGGMHHLSYSSLSIPVNGILAKAKSIIPSWYDLLFAMGLLILSGLLVALLSIKARKWMQRAFHDRGRPQLLIEIMALLMIEVFILSNLSPGHLLTETVTTGGDTASHYYTLSYLRHELLPKGKISGWTHGNYAGFPILQFYFPLPFLLMCGLDAVLPLQVAFKWVTALGIFLLPVSAYVMLRLLKSAFPGPAIGAALTLPFLFNTGNAMWGGNILSTFAGEFSYSLSFALAFMFLGSLYRGCLGNRWVIRNAFLVFLVGFSHGYALLFSEAMSLFFLVTSRGFTRRVVYLGKVYILGFLLLAFWLVPLLAFAKYTTPYHSVWFIDSIKKVTPAVLLPVIILAGASSIAILIHRVVNRGTDNWDRLSVLGFLWFGLIAAGWMFVVAPVIGVVDIRFLPFAQLLVCLIAALGLGLLGERLRRWGLTWAYLLVGVGLAIGWTHSHMEKVPDWSKWNYEGFEAKPAWALFQKINDSLRGTFQDPRVVFEHSSKHRVFGSTRAFESLPLFAGRATLEGLYMQASVSAPFIFYIQSEISKQKSCPFKQYTYTDLDFKRARRHLEMFNVRELILRSPEAKAAILATSGYRLHRTFGEYEIWELTDYQSGYVVPLQYEPVLFPTRDWKIDAFRWFVDERLYGVHLVFVSGSSGRDKDRFKIVTHSLKDVKKIPIDTRSCYVKEEIRNNEIRIETNWINKPLLVRVSYHPNWHVEGAERIYLASPSFMLIYPQRKDVRLYYGPRLPDRLGLALTLMGLFVTLLHVPLPWGEKRTGRFFIGKRLQFLKQLKDRWKWDPSQRKRRILFAYGLFGAILVAGWTGYRIYTGQPNRLFNQAIELKDAKRFHEARERFRAIVQEVSSISYLAAESAYYIGICYYLESDYPRAIRAFEDLIERYPLGRRTQEALYHIGLCYFRLEKEKQGIKQMQWIMKNYPGTMWARYARDRLIEHDVLDEEPLPLTKETLKQQMGRALRLFNKDRLDEARPIFEEISRQFPWFKGASQALACLALTFYKKKDYRQTIHYYQQLVERYPGDPLVPEAHYHIGRSYEMMGDVQKAAYAYRVAAQGFPGSKYGQRAAKRLQELNQYT